MSLEIAKEIYSQIMAQRVIAWSWGFNTPMSIGPDESHYGGLEFKVNGAILKGKVEVLLMPSDTYKVTGYNRKGTKKFEYTDIYCDQLVEIIDKEVETKC